MKRVISSIGFVILLLGIAPIAMATLDSNFIIEDGVEYYIQTDKSVYNLGENVEMLFRVTNLNPWTVSFEFTGEHGAFNIFVKQNDDDIWAVSRFSVWNPPFTIDLPAGEFIEFPTTEFRTWDMKDYDGNLVTSGAYDVVGVMYTDPLTEVGVPITIIPEPASLTSLIFGLYFLRHFNKKRI